MSHKKDYFRSKILQPCINSEVGVFCIIWKLSLGVNRDGWVSNGGTVLLRYQKVSYKIMSLSGFR